MADQTFLPDERLIRRLPEDAVKNGKVLLAAIELPDISCNREKGGGRPEYVLFPNWKHFGIACVSVGQLPPVQFEDGREYCFAPWHDPLPDNYFHTEIRCYYGNKHVNPLDLMSYTAQLKWRRRLQAQMKLLKHPEDNAT